MTEPERAHPRYAVTFEVELHIGQEKMVGQTCNVSRGGLCLELPSPVGRGAECSLKLALVFSENSFSEQLSLTGMVMWCSPNRSQFQVGVKFDKLDERTIGYLDTCLHYLEMGELPEDESRES